MLGHLEAVIQMSQGANTKPPDVNQLLAEFDEWLVSPMESKTRGGRQVDETTAQIEQALGV